MVAIVTHGMLEGVAFGMVFSLIFAVVTGFISRLCCSFRLGLQFQLKVIGIALVFWLVGGCNSLLLAWFRPDFYVLYVNPTIRTIDTIRFAWVEGSILGIYGGGIVALVAGCNMFVTRWRHMLREEESALLAPEAATVTMNSRASP